MHPVIISSHQHYPADIYPTASKGLLSPTVSSRSILTGLNSSHSIKKGAALHKQKCKWFVKVTELRRYNVKVYINIVISEKVWKFKCFYRNLCTDCNIFLFKNSVRISYFLIPDLMHFTYFTMWWESELTSHPLIDVLVVVSNWCFNCLQRRAWCARRAQAQARARRRWCARACHAGRARRERARRPTPPTTRPAGRPSTPDPSSHTSTPSTTDSPFGQYLTALLFIFARGTIRSFAEQS